MERKLAQQRTKRLARPLRRAYQHKAAESLAVSEIWWTWSGSNRRPLPCHFSSSTETARHQQIASEAEGQCSCALASVPCPSPVRERQAPTRPDSGGDGRVMTQVATQDWSPKRLPLASPRPLA